MSDMTQPNRVSKGHSTGGQFAARQRAEADVTLDLGSGTAPEPRYAPDPGRDAWVDEIVKARGVEHEAGRDLRDAKTALARSLEFPPAKALVRRRVRKAQERFNTASNALARAEQGLRDWDSPIANGGPTRRLLSTSDTEKD